MTSVVTPTPKRARVVKVRIPAKLNLQLSIGPLRDDGYHDVVTVYHAVALYDEVTVRTADRTSVTVRGEGASEVPVGKANLAVRAVAALARATGRRGLDAAVRIDITKRIPVAAGLAGGSADAAGALMGCNELWETDLSQNELIELGVELGSDVPFALLGGTAVGQGRGEQLTRALVAGNYQWVLAFSSTGLATPDVYAASDRLRADRDVPRPQLSLELMAALRSGRPAAIGPLLSNDLQPAALSLQPALRRTLAAGLEFGALGAIVSGSGPTCAFLARDGRLAKDLAVAITSAGVCKSVVQVIGSVPGAVIIGGGDR